MEILLKIESQDAEEEIGHEAVISMADSVLKLNNYSAKPTAGTMTLPFLFGGSSLPVMVMGDDTVETNSITETDFWIDDTDVYPGIVSGLTIAEKRDPENDSIIQPAYNDTLMLDIFCNGACPFDNIEIFFDSARGQRATSLRWRIYSEGIWSNWITEENNQRVWSWLIRFGREAEEVQVEFLTWYRQPDNHRIAAINIRTPGYDFDEEWQDGISITQQVKPYGPAPVFDLIYDTGRANLIDINKELKATTEEGDFPVQAKCTVLVNNKVLHRSEAKEWGEYSTAGSALTLKIERLPARIALTLPGESVRHNQTFRTLLFEILDTTFYQGMTDAQKQSEFQSMCNKTIITGSPANPNQEQTIWDFLGNINAPMIIHEQESAQQRLAKLLFTTQLAKFFDEDGKLCIDTARPRITTGQKANPVVITAQQQTGDWEEVITPENKYGNATLNISKIIGGVQPLVIDQPISGTSSHSFTAYGPTSNQAHEGSNFFGWSNNGWADYRYEANLNCARTVRQDTVSNTTLHGAIDIIAKTITAANGQPAKEETPIVIRADSSDNLADPATIARLLRTKVPGIVMNSYKTYGIGLDRRRTASTDNSTLQTYVRDVLRNVIWKLAPDEPSNRNPKEISPNNWEVRYELVKVSSVTTQFYKWNISGFNAYGWHKTGVVVCTPTGTDAGSTFTLRANASSITFSQQTRVFSQELVTMPVTVTNNQFMQAEVNMQGGSPIDYFHHCFTTDYNTYRGIRRAVMTVMTPTIFRRKDSQPVADINKANTLPPNIQLGEIVSVLDEEGKPRSTRNGGEPRLWKVTGKRIAINGSLDTILELMEVW